MFFRIPVYILVVFSLIYNPFLVQAETVIPKGPFFTRNLYLGTYGDDVLLLQKVLNLRPETQVSAIGAGSPGQESKYFGLMTLGAVRRFQVYYRNEVLVPVGIYSATGFVGPSTRAKLETLVGQIGQPITNTVPAIGNTQSAPSVSGDTTPSRLITITPTSGPHGTLVRITGTNLAEFNDIYTGTSVLKNQPLINGGIEFIVESPAPENIRSKIDYLIPVPIYIDNKYGRSNPIVFYVTK